jgi:hypothetical protein
MPDNNRIFYACQAVYVDGTYLQNVQAVGIDYSADATGISDTGRSQQQRSFYSKPEITISIQREVNTTATPFYTPASVTSYANAYILKQGNLGTAGWDTRPADLDETPPRPLADIPLKEYSIEVAYGSDDLSGNIESQTLNHCLLTEVSYEIGADGGMTENLSFVTRNLIKSGSAAATIATPLSGTIFKRQHLDVENDHFILPSEVKSVVDLEDSDGNDVARAIQSISINASFDYGELTDVGKWRGSNQGTAPTEQNKWKYITTPIGVTCKITAVIRKSIEQNILIKDNTFMDSPTPNREIKIIMGHELNRFVIDLGKKNYLTEISFSGGDVGGGNVEATFSYTNTNNDFVPYKGQPQDLAQSTKY